MVNQAMIRVVNSVLEWIACLPKSMMDVTCVAANSNLLTLRQVQ